jgi:DNA-binding CsgD family transcriptional regulator
MAVPSTVAAPTGETAPLLDVARAGVDPAAPRVLLLTGPPGIGRTTTLDRLTAALREGGADVRVSRPDDVGRATPHGLLATLARLDGSPGADVMTHLVDTVLAALERDCRERPLVLAVDDAHRADPDALAALARVAGLTPDLPVAYVLTRRPHPERSTLAALARRPDTREVLLGGLDDAGRDRMVRARFGVPPGERLRSLAAQTGGVPVRLAVLLDGLDHQGRIRVDDEAAELLDVPEPAAGAVRASTHALLGLLDTGCLELLRVLAVADGPATPAELAAVLDTTPAAVVGTAERAIAADVLTWTDDGGVGFRHADQRRVVLDGIHPRAREVLAAAWQRPADGGPTPDLAATLAAVTTDVAGAPARAGERLDALAAAVGDGPGADAVALERAGAKAVSGDVTEAERIAREGRAGSEDPVVRARLTRLIVFTLVSAAQVDAARREIDAALAHVPPGSPPARALTEARRWVEVLGGRAPVDPAGPPDDPEAGGSALVADAVELFLRARATEALARAERAAAHHDQRDAPPWQHGPTAQVWPAFLALYAHGPDRARELSVDARRRLHREGRTWLTPYHLFVSAAVHVAAGRWDDAVAEAESGLEAAEATGTGWISLPTATLLQTWVRRGRLDEAAARIRRWKTRDLPEQFGLPFIAHAEALLLEATDRLDDAAALVARCWSRAVGSGRIVWTLVVGGEALRIALAAGDDDLVARIAEDVAGTPVDGAGGIAPTADLVAAVVGRDPGGAAAAALRFRELGHVLGELTAWELAADVAARVGDRERTTEAARQCTALATALDAGIVERRLASRLRAHGHRQGSTASRGRPRDGWESLTPTEREVTELVAAGLTSPQVAARMFVSPRTIQTHISHVLRKLGLRSRVELAAAVAARQRA